MNTLDLTLDDIVVSVDGKHATSLGLATVNGYGVCGVPCFSAESG